MTTSSELGGVAKERGEAQRVQKSRGSPSGVGGGTENNKELQNAGTDSTLLLAVGSATPVHGTNLPASWDDQVSGTETVETADDVTAATATAVAVETVEGGASEEECTASASAAEGEEEQRAEAEAGRQAPPATTTPAAAGDEKQGGVVSEALELVVSTAPAPPAPAATGDEKRGGEGEAGKPGEAQRIQKSRGSLDLRDQIRTDEGRGSSSSSSDGGSERDESGTVSASEAGIAAAPGAARTTRAAAREATAEKQIGGGSAGGCSTAAESKGNRKTTSTLGQSEQRASTGSRNKRCRSGGAGGKAKRASATEHDSETASGTGRAEKKSKKKEDSSWRVKVWAEGFSDDEAAMNFDDEWYESDVEGRNEKDQKEKDEAAAFNRKRQAQREKEKKNRRKDRFYGTKTPSEKEMERLLEAPIQVFREAPIQVDSIRSWGARCGFHAESRCDTCQAGAKLKPSKSDGESEERVSTDMRPGVDYDEKFTSLYNIGLILTTPGAKPVSQFELSQLMQSKELRTARTKRALTQKQMREQRTERALESRRRR